MIGDTKLQILKRNMEERFSTTSAPLPPPTEEEALEALFDEAQRGEPLRKIRRNTDPASRQRLPPTAKSMHDLFSPQTENWTRVGGVALVHKETQTLLGNFSEYHHVSTSAIDLRREEAPISVSRTLEVSGSWWLGSPERIVAHSVWHETRKALLKVYLESLGLFNPLVELAVQLSHGGIARVELMEATLFADREGAQLLTLPAGLNILPVMSLDGKIELRKEIGL